MTCRKVRLLDHLLHIMQVFNVVIGKMVTAVLWTSPLGIASLIAASICRACDLVNTLGALGLWVATVLLGLALQGGLVLPAALWGCTRNSPWATVKGFSQAIVLGFGTSSSSAALPVGTLRTLVSLPFKMYPVMQQLTGAAVQPAIQVVQFQTLRVLVMWIGI